MPRMANLPESSDMNNPEPTPTPAEPSWERWEPVSFKPTTLKPGAAGGNKLAATGGKPTVEKVDAEAVRRAAQDEGYRAGFESGRAEGYQAGHEAAQAEGRQLAAQLGAAIERFDQGVANLEQDVAQQLLNLALGIARRIVGDTLEAQPETVLASIREALAQLPAQHAVIHLNSEDAELIRTHHGDALARAGHRILDNPQLARGDVLVDAGGTQVDSRLATRWQRVWEALEPEPMVKRNTP